MIELITPNNYLLFVLIVIATSPFAAILDYFALRKNFVLACGDPPPKFYWLIPCILELLLFGLGIIVGANI